MASGPAADLDRWRREWEALPSLAERQEAAARPSELAASALRAYTEAYERDLNSHSDGIAVVALLKVFEHLHLVTGRLPLSAEPGDLFDLIPCVRVAGRVALRRAEHEGDAPGAARAHATLAELLVVAGDQASAVDRDAAVMHYVAASQVAEVGEALRDRFRMYAALGFHTGLLP